MPDTTVENDVQIARHWWAGVAPKVPTGLRALWFGVVEVHRDDGPSRELYVAATDVFDADDETAEWAVDPAWLVNDGYIALPALAALPKTAYDEQVEHAATVVRALASHESAGASLEGVAVGFDDGDFELIWTATGSN